MGNIDVEDAINPANEGEIAGALENEDVVTEDGEDADTNPASDDEEDEIEVHTADELPAQEAVIIDDDDAPTDKQVDLDVNPANILPE